MTNSKESREILIGRQGEGRIAFGAPSPILDGSGYVRLPFRVEIDGLSASNTIDLEDWGGGVDGLIAYFAGMAESWRGWPAAMDWHDDGGQIRMSAAHDGKGTVALSVFVYQDVRGDSPGSWTLRAVLALDPGSLQGYVMALRAHLDQRLG